MTTVFTSGHWRARPGEEEAFVESWTEFARWLTTFDGAGTPRLTRDLGDPGGFFSFAPWRDIDAVHAWKSDREFRERMGEVRRHVTDFTPSELELVAEVDAGAPQPR
jgi:heme-degrading monooxygenase HmoA